MLNSFEGDKYVTEDKEHDRTETRLSMVVHNKDLSVLGDIEFEWPELKTMRIVVISSKESNVKGLLCAIRGHWLVESKLWTLDITFGEDACRKRAEERAENFARIGQMFLNCLNVKHPQKRASSTKEPCVR